MVVQDDSDDAFSRIFRIEVTQQANEFDTAVAVFHARRSSSKTSSQYDADEPDHFQHQIVAVVPVVLNLVTTCVNVVELVVVHILLLTPA